MGNGAYSIRAFLLAAALLIAVAPPDCHAAAAESDKAPEDLAPTYRIESILIEGNAHTDAQVVKNLVNLKPGDIFVENLAEESRFKLLTSGYFRNVRVSLRKGSERGKVVVVFTVEERGTLLVDEVHIGFSDVNYFWAGAAITEMNLAGKGFQLTGGAVGGQDMLGLKLRFLDPNVKGSEWKIGGALMYNNAREATTDQFYTDVQTLLWYWRAGLDFTVGRRLSNYFHINFGYHFEVDKAGYTTNIVPPDWPQIRPGFSFLSALNFSVSRDTRNDPWLPTAGWMFNLAIKFSSIILGSSYEYTKYTLDVEVLLPTFKGHSWKLRLFGGYVQQGDKPAPFYDTYFLGDYFYFSIQKPTLPRVWEINVTGLISYKPIAYAGGMEYAIPIFKPSGGLYRGYIYAVVLASGTTSVEEITGKGSSGITPVSFDIGLKLDTSVGIFTISAAYWANLGLMWAKYR